MAEQERILVVDDSVETAEVIERNLQNAGYNVLTSTNVDKAVKILVSTDIDLVITDLKMPGASGLDLVRYVRENCPDTEVMMITGYATVEGAVAAIKIGAEEYLKKPFTDQELIDSVTNVLNKLTLKRAANSRMVVTPKTPQGMIGESEAITKVYRSVAKAARTITTVLLTGESGTGKELFARSIHYSSPRAASSFVAVNCGGIPESLLESELFGYLKGSFTGAGETRAGFFQTADGGTIFLDEVSETSLGMQVKLLRVLQEKEIYMVGSSRPQTVDVRILAATNKDLNSLVDKGMFREDLYYRLNVIPIEIPPLRERGDDILLLINHFVRLYASGNDRSIPRFTTKALGILRNYHWPGNVRELQNIVNRLIVMTDGDTIDVPDLPSLMRAAVPKESGSNRTLAEVEADHIRVVLQNAEGNKSKAAEILGIDRKTLREKLKKSS